MWFGFVGNFQVVVLLLLPLSFKLIAVMGLEDGVQEVYESAPQA